MSIEKRQHIRFSLDIPAIRCTKYGETVATVLHQISIGGCLAACDESVYTGDVFRLLIQLPNKNFLPLKCKVLYQFTDNGIGTKFMDITQFEQELLSRIIIHNLEKQGMPLLVDPFAQPKEFNRNKFPTITNNSQRRDEILENILSIDNVVQ